MPGYDEYKDAFAKAEEIAKVIGDELKEFEDNLDELSKETGPRPLGGRVADQYPAGVFRPDLWSDLRDKFVQLKDKSEKLKSIKGMGANAAPAAKLDTLCQALKDACFRLQQQSMEHRGSSEKAKVRFENWEPVTLMWLFKSNYDSMMFKDFNIPALKKPAVALDFNPQKIDQLGELTEIAPERYASFRDPEYETPTMENLRETDNVDFLLKGMTYEELNPEKFGNMLSWGLVKKDVTDFVAEDKKRMAPLKTKLKSTKDAYEKAKKDHAVATDRRKAEEHQANIEAEISQLQVQQEALARGTETPSTGTDPPTTSSAQVQQLKEQIAKVQRDLDKNKKESDRVALLKAANRPAPQSLIDQLASTKTDLETKLTGLQNQLQSVELSVSEQSEQNRAQQRDQQTAALNKKLADARKELEDIKNPQSDAVVNKAQAAQAAYEEMDEASTSTLSAEREFVTWLNEEQKKRVEANTARLRTIVTAVQSQSATADTDFLKEMAESVKGRDAELAHEFEEMESASH